jgi:uncharacterized cupin superfamily protein
LKPSHCLKRLCLQPASQRPARLRLAKPPHSAPSPWAGQSTLHRTSSSSIAVREYEPGEFEWRADLEHSGCVLAGSGTLLLADGRQVNLRPGTSFYLPRGMHGHWLVEKRLRTVVVEHVNDD